MLDNGLTTEAIAKIFRAEVTRFNGRIKDKYQDKQHLFIRSVLSQEEEVRPKDRVNSGVALKAAENQVHVYPYVFRQVCRNGAIMAHAQEGRKIILDSDDTCEETETQIREAICSVARPEVFADAVAGMRSAAARRLDFELAMLPLLSTLGNYAPPAILQHIFGRFMEHEEKTQFGLMNAITSVARDTSDPERRWRLEELGGAVGANVIQPLPSDETGAAIRYDASSRKPVTV